MTTTFTATIITTGDRITAATGIRTMADLDIAFPTIMVVIPTLAATEVATITTDTITVDTTGVDRAVAEGM